MWIAIPYKGLASPDTLHWYKDRGIKIDSKHSIMWIPSICPNLELPKGFDNKFKCKIQLTKNNICKKGNCGQKNALPQEAHQ